MIRALGLLKRPVPPFALLFSKGRMARDTGILTVAGETFHILGKSIPIRRDAELVPLGFLCVRDWRFEVELAGRDARCGCRIWEHTIYEMEVLSTALRCAAADEFPPSIQIPTPESELGTPTTLRPAVVMELGYCIDRPGDARARVSCNSRRRALRGPIEIFLGIAIDGSFNEVAIDAVQAEDLATWLDRQIRWIYLEAAMAEDAGEDSESVGG